MDDGSLLKRVGPFKKREAVRYSYFSPSFRATPTCSAVALVRRRMKGTVHREILHPVPVGVRLLRKKTFHRPQKGEEKPSR